MATKTDPKTWVVPRLWEGQDAFLIAGGPSVAAFDLKSLKGKNCIAVNTSFRIVPWANFIYFADHRWAAWWKHELVKVKHSVIVTTATTHRFSFPVKFLGRDRAQLLTTDQDQVCGFDSGMHALQFSYLLGAARIFLVGYDMTFERVPKKFKPEDADQEKRVRDLQTPTPVPGKATTQKIPDVEAMSHHHKEHPTPSRLTNYEKRFRPQYPIMITLLKAKGVELVSLTPTSIPDMPVVTLEGIPCPIPIARPPKLSPRLVYESRRVDNVWRWATRSPESP